MTKFIFVTGGVVSGLGKGITAAALGRLLKQRGLKVAAQKFDPYMNVDPGMMSPFQHGEVFVTDDGAETDLDLGHYERFIDENLTKFSSLTSGKVYWSVLEGERAGYYLGNTVQVIPHVTEFIKNCAYSAAIKSQADVLITEIGGTTGDIEGEPFLEAIRQISLEKGIENCLYVHVALVPYLKGVGEHKSKPTQHSVRDLCARGIYPNIIIARSDQPLSNEVKEKIAFFCNVKPDCVIENMTLSSLYEAPLMLHQNGFDSVVCRELGLETPEPDLSEWQMMVQKIAARENEIHIALIGKYVRFHDAYLSIIESLNHAGFASAANVTIRWIDSEELNARNVEELLQGINGMIIPGDFGDSGIEGKIAACRFAREKNIPFLGISHGMHVAVIEFARHLCGLNKAHSIEFDEITPYPVINIMSGLIEKQGMRLGAHLCNIVQGTRLHGLYGYKEINERHRHRFGLNNDYRNILETHGLLISGTSSDHHIVEAIELPQHPFFIGVQYHPEFKSRPNRPHALFLGLLQSALTSPAI